jgi:hypothetical protein
VILSVKLLLLKGEQVEGRALPNLLDSPVRVIIEDGNSDVFPRSVNLVQIRRQLCRALVERPDFPNP